MVSTGPFSLVQRFTTTQRWAGPIIRPMNTSTPSAASSDVIDDLYALILADGLPVEVQGKTIRYRTVRLRETGVAHERAAVRQAERVMLVNGAPKLLVSDSEFRFALTAQHVESFECDGVRIQGGLIDLNLISKLSTHDFGLIEQRVFLVNLAAEVRYGTMSQADFDLLLSGGKKDAAAPQPVGQAPDVGADAAAPESGPAMLADYAGSGAAGATAGHGG